MNKSGPKGPRPDSAATYIRGLILDGFEDDEIQKRVTQRFPGYHLITKSGKSVITWYRWDVVRRKMRGEPTNAQQNRGTT